MKSREVTFTEENIRELFGHEAAEDESLDNLKRYYLKLDVYNQLSSAIPLFILVGHKGIGKSALLKVLSDENMIYGNISIVLAPDDVLTIDLDTVDFLAKIRTWKDGLSEKIFESLINSCAEILNNGKDIPPVIQKLEKLVFNIFGKKIFDIQEQHIGITAKEFSKITKNELFEKEKITIYLDDLDRGWKNRKEDVENLSAMLNAVRDLSRDNSNLKFRIALRSDVYYAVRTSDETTDKIDGSVVWQSWTNHEILVMLIKRIESFFGRPVDERNLLKSRQSEIAHYLDNIFERNFQGAGHWENAPMYRVLMSLIRKRPRDLVKLCTLAARNAAIMKHAKIGTRDLESVFSAYSNDRLTDTSNEYKSEFPSIRELLLKMKPTQAEIKNGKPCVFNRAELLNKLKNVLSQSAFRFSDGHNITPDSLAAFLYKINFLTARKNVDGKIRRIFYDENRYLYNEFTDFGYGYEIHPAYRWALQPDTPEILLKQIDDEID
ncbi:MAG: hypothetical protein E7199_07160 [Schwartzia succinivorans]|nr:hypothetical protein [Schwartzia succinivorans]